MSEIRAQACAGDIRFVVSVPTRPDGASALALEEIVRQTSEGFRAVWAEASDFYGEGDTDDEEAATGDSTEG